MSRPLTPGTPRSGPGARWRRRVRILDLGRAVSWHRRKLAVVAAVAAVLTSITAAAPPESPTVPVVRATVALVPGSTISADQVRLERLPAAAVPRESVDEVAAVVGRTVVGGVPVGQVLTVQSTVTSASVRPGRVIAPLRLDDAGVASLLRVGDHVDVLSAAGQRGTAVVLVSRARIVSVPAVESSGGVGASGSGGALVLLDVDLQAATKLAQAAVATRLSVVLRS